MSLPLLLSARRGFVVWACWFLKPNTLALTLALSSALSGCREAPVERKPAGPPPPGVVAVRVETTKTGFQLLRDGQPYFIKGAAGTQQLAELKRAGGNSVRVWATDDADKVLDEAHRLGLTVMLGVWLGREVEGFNYYDQDAVARQKESVRQQILRFRHHPALLMWNLGNELDLEASKPVVYKAVNDLARMVHELDPHHPVTTSMSGRLHMLRYVTTWCPDLDVLSVNAFGSLHSLPADLEDAGWERPYLVTEFGGKGYWESPVTPWRAPLEETSSTKADYLRQLYTQSVLGDSAQCLGAYVFFWGNKQEFTSSWFSLFTPAGDKTPEVDALYRLWSGREPDNQAPRISTLQVGGRNAKDHLRLRPGATYPVQVAGQDPEGDLLAAQWLVTPDLQVGVPYEQRIIKPTPVAGAIEGGSGLRTTLRTPTRPGAYRLSVTLSDGKGSGATANLPFYVVETR